jgi:Spy/CpxP family protein refolding chaperone
MEDAMTKSLLNKRMLAVFGVAAMTLALLPETAEARRHGHGRFGHRGHHKHGHMRCMGMLFRAPQMMLKQKLGLSDAQVKKIESIRMNFMQKRITLRANMQRQRLKMRALWQQDLPSQNAVLSGMRKLRSIRGTLMEERVKASLWMMGTLTKQQRQKLRQKCWKRHHHRWGKRGQRFHRRGMRGFHRGHRGHFNPRASKTSAAYIDANPVTTETPAY